MQFDNAVGVDCGLEGEARKNFGALFAGAVLKAGTSGVFVVLPDDEGRYNTVGLFLEGGSAGEYVDMIVERGSITIPEA